jgi:predicted DNA-binding transcriptional regulator AlpA
MMLPNLVPRAEVERALGKSRRTLIEWAKQGYGPQPYRIGGEVMYDAAEVTQWINAQRIEPTTLVA